MAIMMMMAETTDADARSRRNDMEVIGVVRVLVLHTEEVTTAMEDVVLVLTLEGAPP